MMKIECDLPIKEILPYIERRYDKRCCLCDEWATWICPGINNLPPALCDKHFFDQYQEVEKE